MKQRQDRTHRPIDSADEQLPPVHDVHVDDRVRRPLGRLHVHEPVLEHALALERGLAGVVPLYRAVARAGVD